MTIKFNNVYIKNTSTIAGNLEKQGPLNKYFDKTHNDFYINSKSLEKSEVNLQKESINTLIDKTNIEKEKIDLLISGDLQNQITASCYAAKDYEIPFLGVYSACATSTEEIILASTMIESNNAKNIICTTSSNNLVSEKQFRNPVEYGAPSPKTKTFTATGGASILLTNEKTNIKIASGTIGKIIDLNQKDPNHMGAVMAPAAADTIYNHLKNNNETPNDYDLILTGDLGIYGKKILKEYINEKYNIKLGENYKDCGEMLYDLKKQNEITAGGSGPVCSALVTYGYIYDEMKKQNLNKVLLVATGALFSPTFIYQKENILSIAHAIAMEVQKWPIYIHFYSLEYSVW